MTEAWLPVIGRAARDAHRFSDQSEGACGSAETSDLRRNGGAEHSPVFVKDHWLPPALVMAASVAENHFGKWFSATLAAIEK